MGRRITDPSRIAERLTTAAVRETGDHRAAEEAHRAAAAANRHNPAIRSYHEQAADRHNDARRGVRVSFFEDRAGRHASPVADLRAQGPGRARETVRAPISAATADRQRREMHAEAARTSASTRDAARASYEREVAAAAARSTQVTQPLAPRPYVAFRPDPGYEAIRRAHMHMAWAKTHAEAQRYASEAARHRSEIAGRLGPTNDPHILEARASGHRRDAAYEQAVLHAVQLHERAHATGTREDHLAAQEAAARAGDRAHDSYGQSPQQEEMHRRMMNHSARAERAGAAAPPQRAAATVASQPQHPVGHMAASRPAATKQAQQQQPQALKRGPRGGSYYISPTGKKVYV